MIWLRGFNLKDRNRGRRGLRKRNPRNPRNPLFIVHKLQLCRAARFRFAAVVSRRNASIFACVALATVLASGCQSTEHRHKKQISTLRVHLEVSSSETNHTQIVSIPRDQPIQFKVQNAPFLTEAEVKEAKIVSGVGGFQVQIQFDMTGSLLLEEYSGSYRGWHFAIFSQFVNPANEKQNLERWLAAPRASRRITDGLLAFTPDASREEAEQIVRGLNNLARKQGGQK
jgi:hypothetical protein